MSTIWDVAQHILSGPFFILIPPGVVFLSLYLLFPKLTIYETFWSSFPLGYTLATWIVFIISCFVGHIDKSAVHLTYILFTLIFLILIVKFLGNINSQNRYHIIILDIRKEFYLNLLIAITFLYFFFIFSTHLLYKDRLGVYWSGGSVWADLAFHLNVINSFAFGENKYFGFFTIPKSTIFAGGSMSYPFIPDFHASTLVVAGMTVRQATFLPSVFISVSLCVLLFCFARRVFTGTHLYNRSFNLQAFLGVFLFLLCGGIGGWTMLRDKPFTLDTIVNEDWMQKTSSGEELFWFHVVCHIILPQRSAMFAYPLALLVFICLFSINDNNLARFERVKFFLLAGAVTGLLPLVHAHSFVGIGLIAAVYCILHPAELFDFSSSGHFNLWLAFGLPIILLSAPQMPSYLHRILHGESEGEAFIRLTALWRNSPWISQAPSFLPDLNFFILWWKALNFLFPLSFIGIFFLNSVQRKLYLAFIFVFFVGNFVMFQPWDKDNNKIFVIWLMLSCFVAVNALFKLFGKYRITRIVIPILFIAMIFSGTVMCIRETRLWWEFMDKDDVHFAESIKLNTAHDSIWITNDDHIHPVSNLAGRSVVFGFAGWVHSHGYPNLWERQDEQKIFLRHPQRNVEFLKKHNISYLCWDTGMDADLQFFNNSPYVKRILQTRKYTVFDLRELRDK